MTIEEALSTVRRYTNWRRGEDLRRFSEVFPECTETPDGEAFPALSVYPTVDSLVEWASGATRNGLPAEGYVLKSLDDKTHFKVLNPIYLLKAD